MSLELIQQQAVKTYNENVAYFKEHHPKLYQNLVFFETALNEKHIQAKYDLQWKESYFEIIGLEQSIPFYGQNSLELSKKMVDNSPLFDATKNSFKTYYDVTYNDEVADIGLNSDMLVKYTLSNAPIVHYVNKNLPSEQLLTDIHKFIIFGVGLGLHISYIHEQIQGKMYCIVEPNLEIFRLSLFVTNYAQLAKQAKLFLCVAQSEVEFRETFNKFYAESFILNHYLKFFQFGQGHDLYIKTIQNFLVSQPHYLYSYDRTFLSLLRTHSYISQGYNTLNIKESHSTELFNKPVLYLAAGPSLQRNIEFVKKNQDKFIIVAIYATMPILERHNIKPQIITQYDEQDMQVLRTLEDIQDLEFFKNTIFIFSSHVNAKLMSTFPKEHIFIFQAMFELKTEFGMLTSPSIGELTYGLLLKLGAKNIYILGLDLAMDVKTNQTHIEGHKGSNAFNQLKDLEESDDTQYSYRKNTILVKGNFLPEVKSIPVFKTNIDSFGVLTKQFKSADCNVYNLSNGAYLEGAQPLSIETIKINDFNNRLNEINPEIINVLNSISESNYNHKDIENINLKISGAKKIKKVLEQFFKIKTHKSIEEYKNKLIIVLSDILFKKYHCEDLQQILINYSSHVIHHIFYLFTMKDNKDFKKHTYEINKILNKQLHKIVNTYVISISYSKSENNITKKLNKYLKEFSIKNTSYSEPQFKELVETSIRRELNNYKNSAIGLFASEDTLLNKEFVNYLIQILDKNSNISLKLFYFYEHQKILSQQTFKKYMERVEHIIPTNIESITNKIELWIETSSKTFSLKKVTDIILNNYTNIYSIMYSKESYHGNLKNLSSNNQAYKLAQQLEEQGSLKNTDYFYFCNELKSSQNILNKKNLYKKDTVGFFALEENLTKEFVKTILDVYNNFPNIQFSIFYFENKQKQQIELQFANLLSRFNFIKPSNINDITSNTELWIQAKIKHQSYLFNRVTKLLLQTFNIFPLIIESEEHIKQANTYLDAMIENYQFTALMRNIPQVDINLSNQSIGFLANEFNLQDRSFLEYIELLSEKFSVPIMTYCFNQKDKTLFDGLNDKLKSRVVLVDTIHELISNLRVFIHNSNHSELNIPANQLSLTHHNIFVSFHDVNLANIYIKDIKMEKENPYLNSLLEIGISQKYFEVYNYEYHTILNSFLFKQCDYSVDNLREYTLYDMNSIYHIELALKSNLFTQQLCKLKNKQYRL